MTGSTFVVVSGAPGTGKTTLGRHVAAGLRIPFISKDLIKEALFDALGVGDREWSRKLGVASVEVLFKVVESALEAGQSLVVDNTFHGPLDARRFERLRVRYGARVVEVHCETRDDVLQARLRERVRRGERHPGHVETPEMLAEVQQRTVNGDFALLGLGDTVRVDTTDWREVDPDALVAAVRRTLDRDNDRQ